MKNFDRVNFTLDYLNIDWTGKLDRYKDDTNKAFQFFYWKINKLLDKYMPWKKITNKEYKLRYKPWIKKDVLTKIQEKNKKFHQFTKCKDPTLKAHLKSDYKIIKNEVTSLSRQRKKEYYQKYFTENKTNIKKIWLGIKEIINTKHKAHSKPAYIKDNGNTLHNPRDVANSFNNYFSNIADDILNERKFEGNTSHRKYLTDPLDKTFVAYECDEKEIESLITTLNPRKGTGPNSVPANILHMLKIEISTPLSILFNISLNTGTFPDLLKPSKVTPVYKKGSKMIICNYRPISLLSNVNKLFEKVMFNRVYQFLETNKCIYNLQFGFRSKHSTNHALIEITEKIRHALDNSEIACGVFIDLQKAFDTVNHDILVDKLEYYGIRGVAKKWFKSYLAKRSQHVSIEGFKSDMKEIKHGVPQGSVLGPLLFLLYINDLHKSIHYCKAFHFADDTHLLNISTSSKRIQKQVNIDLKCLFKWLLANKISLNCSKTELIIFKSNRNKDTFKFKIKINGHKILPSDNIKYLGVYLDSDLSGNQHCKILAGKLNRANGMLSKIRHYVTQDELKSIYHAIFSSHLLYNCQVWGQSRSNITSVCKLQNKAMRIINFKDFNAPSNPIYAENLILKLEDIIKQKNCLFVHDFLNGILPDCFEDFFSKLNAVYNNIVTRNSSLGALYLPTINTTSYGLNSVTYKAIQCWNHVTNSYGIDLSNLLRHDLKKKLFDLFTAENTV